MVDVTIYGECCPKCNGDVEDLDCWDNSDGAMVAKMRCVECGHEFEIRQIWILCK